MTGGWRASLAPLGVPSQDRRVVSRDIKLDLPQHRQPILLYGHRPLGEVTGVAVEDGYLWASGTLITASRAVRGFAERMRSGELRPQMELALTETDLLPSGQLMFNRGTLVAVTAGLDPAWPHLAFHLEES